MEFKIVSKPQEVSLSSTRASGIRSPWVLAVKETAENGQVVEIPMALKSYNLLRAYYGTFRKIGLQLHIRQSKDGQSILAWSTRLKKD